MNFLDKASLDYFSISINIKRDTILKESQPGPYHQIKDLIFNTFKIDLSRDLKSNFNKEIFEKNGLNIVFENRRTLLNFKGEFFYQKKAYNKIITLLNDIRKIHKDLHIRRIDIKRHLICKTPDEIFKDIKNGYWIKKSGDQSFFQSDLIKKNQKQSMACYFKSENFLITVYNKTHQIKELEKKLNRYKEPRKSQIKRQIFNHKNKFKDNKIIHRCEIRLLKKDECKPATALINLNIREEIFLNKILESFYKDHALIDKSKNESRRFKSFFE